MEAFLIKALQLVMALSLLVVLHEGGHFTFSKIFGVRVEKFYLFFDAYFHIFSTNDGWFRRLMGRKPKKKETEEGKENVPEVFEGTEYGIGWLPLGGYVKIAGMIDESMDTEQMKQPVQPWEFRAKPAWQRLLIMVGGVLVNFILGFAIYSMVLCHWGQDYVPVQSYRMGMCFNETAKQYGFRDGDILYGVDGKKITSTKTADIFRLVSTARSVTVIRGGKNVNVSLPGDISLLSMIKDVPPFMEMYVPNVVDSVLPGSAAEKAGLEKGDRIISLNGNMITSHNAFKNEIGKLSDQLLDASAKDSIALRHVSLEVRRDTSVVSLSCFCDENMMLGFVPVQPEYDTVHLSYGILESVPAGFSYGWDVLYGYVSDLKYVFTKEGAKSVGGFAAIGSLFPDLWDWHRFWLMTAFLSIVLGFMNILPIPALDGGHVLFLLYEVITGRKPNDKFLEYAQYVGMGLLLLLLLWANLNDVIRFLF